eukprot:4168046-Pyramimonas_sp.AAC.1
MIPWAPDDLQRRVVRNTPVGQLTRSHGGDATKRRSILDSQAVEACQWVGASDASSVMSLKIFSQLESPGRDALVEPTRRVESPRWPPPACDGAEVGCPLCEPSVDAVLGEAADGGEDERDDAEEGV